MSEASSHTKYPSLREWMIADESLSQLSQPLVRLGALYHLDDHNDDDTVIRKIRALLDDADKDADLTKKIPDYLFYLHAAVYLANKNDFQGVKWIIQALVDSSHDNSRFVQIALASCYRFPLAPLISLVLDLSIKKKDISLIEELTEYSEDDFIEWAQKSQVEQSQLFQTFLARLTSIKKLNRKPGMALGLGVILRRPVQHDIGFAHTGFISLQGLDKNYWILPYDISKVINKDNPLLGQSIWQMQGYSGRRAIIVYKDHEPYEIKCVYLLPSALLSADEQEAHLMDLISNGYGTDLATVHSKWSTEKGDRYRLITASGSTSVRSFMAKKQHRGNVFIAHRDNHQPLSTKYSLGKENISKVLDLFIDNTDLGFAVNAARLSKTKRPMNLLLSDRGKYWKQSGESQPAEALYAVEEAPWGLSPFVLVDEYSTSDRVAILSKFFTHSPDNYGITASNFRGRDGHLMARVVKANGKTLKKPLDEAINPGTPIFHRIWIDENQPDKKERDEIIFLTRFALEGACKLCFGIGHEICPTCGGEASTPCGVCKGEGNVPCSACLGTQRCTTCGGAGRYSDTGRTCVKCGGTGLCKYCQKRQGRVRCSNKCEYGRIKCSACLGNGTIECKCGGKKRGRFIEL